MFRKKFRDTAAQMQPLQGFRRGSFQQFAGILLGKESSLFLFNIRGGDTDLLLYRAIALCQVIPAVALGQRIQAMDPERNSRNQRPETNILSQSKTSIKNPAQG